LGAEIVLNKVVGGGVSPEESYDARLEVRVEVRGLEGVEDVALGEIVVGLCPS
jgi:hypothetical protein